jgi:hypothetical protein
MKGPRRRRVALAIALALAAASCGRKGPPSGGPPDIEPPRVVEATPDSGAAHVPLDVIPSLTFSEGMEPRSTNDAIALAPPVGIRSLRWSGRTVRAELAERLRAHQTYTLIVGFGARDRHGNTMAEGSSVVFTTGDSFPPGRIGGRLEAKGFSAGSAYLWCYDETRHHRPDSTGRDFDARVWCAATDVSACRVSRSPPITACGCSPTSTPTARSSRPPTCGSNPTPRSA